MNQSTSASPLANPWILLAIGVVCSLSPATQGDTFGAKYAASNAGMLYTAKSAGSSRPGAVSPAAAGLGRERRA